MKSRSRSNVIPNFVVKRSSSVRQDLSPDRSLCHKVKNDKSVRGEKRQNVMRNLDLVIEELASSNSQEHLEHAIESALEAFAHTRTDLHDEEIRLGADIATIKLLDRTLASGKLENLVSLCSILEMVFRCSTEVLQLSYSSNGPEVVALLIKVIKECLDGMIRGKQVALQSTMKILHRFSSGVRDAKNDMVHNDELLIIISEIASKDVGSGTREDSMGIVRNIALLNKQNRIILAGKSCLLDSIVKTALNEKSHYKVREQCSAIMWYLAMESEKRTHVLFHDGIIESLMKLASDPYLKTKLNAVSALGNLATDPVSKSFLLNYRCGALLDSFLDMFRRSEDADVVRRVGRTLRFLVNERTAPLIVNHEGFLDGLTDCILADKKEESYQSAKVINTVSAQINSPLPEHDSILKALTESAFTEQPATGEIIALTFSEQSTIKENREVMIDHPDLLKALAQMVLDKNCTRETMEYMVCTAGHLCTVIYSKRKLVNGPILSALGKVSECNEKLQSVIAGIVLRLATLPKNRIILGQHSELVACLVKSLRTNGDKQEREKVKETILQLVPLL